MIESFWHHDGVARNLKHVDKMNIMERREADGVIYHIISNTQARAYPNFHSASQHKHKHRRRHLWSGLKSSLATCCLSLKLPVSYIGSDLIHIVPHSIVHKFAEVETEVLKPSVVIDVDCPHVSIVILVLVLTR